MNHTSKHVKWTVRSEGWVEVRVKYPRSQPVCVVGYDLGGVPSTAPGLILPEEDTVFVKAHFRPAYFRASVPDFGQDERPTARSAVHILRAWYGFRPCPSVSESCSCDLELGPMWRWFQACDAHVVSSAMAATKIAA